jgi:two-component system sensor kinase FixL
MLASTFVLIVLLLQVNVLYTRVVSDRERHLKEMQAILVHLSRVNDLGQNVSSLIHEVSQPLSAIKNYLQAGMTFIATGRTDRLKPVLERSSEQVDRATEIVRHLRDFIAGRESEKRVENVPEMLQNATRLALASFSGPTPTIELTCRSAASAFFDRIQIEQVVFNLVFNAAEAMIDSGRRSIIVTTELDSDNMVEVRVADSGPGLSPEIRDRLFQPFVTTKEGGLGIGLSICRVIIEAHGGQLWAEDNPAGGTIFCFTIPCSPITIPSSPVPA